MSPDLTPSEKALAVCNAVLGDARVPELLTAWAGYAKLALDARGLHCLVLDVADDDFAREQVPSGGQYAIQVEVWDAENVFAWRLRLELHTSHDPAVVGFTQLTARFGVGAFHPDSELDTWKRYPLMDIAASDLTGRPEAEVASIAAQVLTKVVKWNNRHAVDAFVQLAATIDESLLP